MKLWKYFVPEIVMPIFLVFLVLFFWIAWNRPRGFLFSFVYKAQGSLVFGQADARVRRITPESLRDVTDQLAVRYGLGTNAIVILNIQRIEDL